MHNIHYLIVNVDSHEDAQETALNDIEDWGNSNNWRAVIGSLYKEDGTTASGESDRWDAEVLDHDEILLNITPGFKYKEPTKSAIDAVLDGKAEKQSDYYLVKTYFEFLYQKVKFSY